MDDRATMIPRAVVADLERAWSDTVEALHARILDREKTIIALRKELTLKEGLLTIARDGFSDAAILIADLLARIDAIADHAPAEEEDHGHQVDGGHAQDPAGDAAARKSRRGPAAREGERDVQEVPGGRSTPAARGEENLR